MYLGAQSTLGVTGSLIAHNLYIWVEKLRDKDGNWSIDSSEFFGPATAYCCSYLRYIPNSIKVALAIGHWQLDIGHLGIRNTMQCFAWVTANNSFPMPNYPMPKATFIELGIYVFLITLNRLWFKLLALQMTLSSDSTTDEISLSELSCGAVDFCALFLKLKGLQNSSTFFTSSYLRYKTFASSLCFHQPRTWSVHRP